MAALTVSTILAWDPAAIYDVFRIAKDREYTFSNFGTNLQRTQNTVADWSGEAGEAFHEAMGRRRAHIDADGHESARVAKAVARAEQDVESVQMRMRAVVKYLNDRHIDVGEDGSLKIHSGWEDNPDAKKALEQQAKTGNGLTVGEIMADADRVDEELAAAMRAAVGDEQLDEDGRPVRGTQHTPPAQSPRSLKGDELNNILQKSGFDALPPDKAASYATQLNKALDTFGITDPKERAVFIAQTIVESGGYGDQYGFVEGGPNAPDSYFINNYSSSNGNQGPEDAVKYKGRGALQITGKNGYAALTDYFKGHPVDGESPDFLAHPELAAKPEYAYLVSAYWWTHPELHARGGDFTELSQQGIDGFRKISVNVRGGSITDPDLHEDRRENAYAAALSVLGAT
ncbi:MULTISPECIES: hypothetical protein [unclassified Mycolicibacterium]|uniref:hypothetical protein n=1 Tax=unclassified Mycolicibacterium TaxID=2636767 RepID=UPI002ED7DD14